MNQKLDFIKSIRLEPDNDKKLLLKIQEQIEKNNFTKSIVLLLTQNLSEEQKKKLKQLYVEQIDNLKQSTQNYKQKIINIRKKLEVT